VSDGHLIQEVVEPARILAAARRVRSERGYRGVFRLSCGEKLRLQFAQAFEITIHSSRAFGGPRCDELGILLIDRRSSERDSRAAIRDRDRHSGGRRRRIAARARINRLRTIPA
jgi:hypothetical protein